MKKYIVMLGFIGSLLFSGSVFANSVGFTTKIKGISPIYDGSVIIYMKDAHAECKNENGGPLAYFYLKIGKGSGTVTELGFKNIYSAALAASIANKDVWIRFEASTTPCYIDRLYIYSL